MIRDRKIERFCGLEVWEEVDQEADTKHEGQSTKWHTFTHIIYTLVVYLNTNIERAHLVRLHKTTALILHNLYFSLVHATQSFSAEIIIIIANFSILTANIVNYNLTRRLVLASCRKKSKRRVKCFYNYNSSWPLILAYKYRITLLSE